MPGAFTKLALSKIKEDGIQDTVHAGKRPGALVGDGESLHSEAVNVGHGADNQVDCLGKVEGEKADSKDQNHNDDHPDGLIFLLADCQPDQFIFLAENFGHVAIASQDGDEGDQEPCDRQCDAVREVAGGAVRRTEIIAYGSVPLGAGGSIDESGQALGDDNEPDHSTHHPGEPLASPFVPGR